MGILTGRPGPDPDPRTPLERIYDESAWNGDCLEYPRRDQQGYGQVRFNSRSGLRAHRVVWQSVHGPIPSSIMVCHTCDNPPCCNIDHLFTGTAADNNRDRAGKGRNSTYWADKTHCLRNHEFTPSNTRIGTAGQRICKTCESIHRKRRYREKKSLL